MRLLIVLLALVALSFAAHHGGKRGKHGGKRGGKYMKDMMGKDHRGVMNCLKECKKCMDDTTDPGEDDDALECYNEHLECMNEYDFTGKKMGDKKEKMMKMFPKIAQFKTCFGKLESCAAGANDNEVVQCAVEMRDCMASGKPENMADLVKLPKHIQRVIKKYLKCSAVKEQKMSGCVRDHIKSVKRMNYGYQMAACVNNIFSCQNKVDSNAGDCCENFMGCKKAITEAAPKSMTEKEKNHPMAKKALGMQQCLETFEEQHGKVSDEQCINDFTGCIVKVEMPMVPAPMLKHGHCLRMLKECNPADATAAETCMKDYHGCLDSMMHKVMQMKHDNDDDDDDDDDK